MNLKSPLIIELRSCLQLAIPLAAVQLSEAAINFIDTIMMGRLGSVVLAAGSLGSITFMTLLLISSGMLSSVGAMAAIACGSGKRDRLRHIASSGIGLTAIASIPMMLLIWNLTPILRQLGQSEDHLAIAQTYFQSIVWGFPAAVGFILLKNLTSALNRPRLITIIMVSGITINVVGNYVLMYGKWGFPALGLAGIGWASTFAFWFKLVAAGMGLSCDPILKSYQLFQHGYRWNFPILTELIQVGTPAALLIGVESTLFMTITYLMGSFGTVSLAAHKIVLETAAMTFMVTVGISYATTMRVGQHLGRQDWDGVRRAGFVGILLSALFMTIMAIILWCFPTSIISIYLDINHPDNQPVIQVARQLFVVAAIFQLFDGIQAVAGGALRGIKDTKIPCLLGFFCYWIIGFSSSYLLGITGPLKEVGLWLGLALGLASASVILSWRFYLKSGE